MRNIEHPRLFCGRFRKRTTLLGLRILRNCGYGAWYACLVTDCRRPYANGVNITGRRRVGFTPSHISRAVSYGASGKPPVLSILSIIIVYLQNRRIAGWFLVYHPRPFTLFSWFDSLLYYVFPRVAPAVLSDCIFTRFGADLPP